MIGRRLSKIFIVCVLATQTAIRAQDPPSPAPDYSPKIWKEFSSTEGWFRVRFPGTPKERMELKPRNIVLHSLTYGVGDFIFYSVTYRDLPSEKEARDYLKIVRETRLEGMGDKLKLISEKQTTRDGYPALLLDFEVRPNRRFRELNVIRGARHYNLLVISYSNQPGAESAYAEIANSFLDSFHLIEPSIPKLGAN